MRTDAAEAADGIIDSASERFVLGWRMSPGSTGRRPRMMPRTTPGSPRLSCGRFEGAGEAIQVPGAPMIIVAEAIIAEPA
jgi:hypothetical protein